MVRIDLQLADKAQWGEIFDRSEFAVFVRHDEPPEIGDSVRLDLTVGAGGPKVILRGHVVSRQPNEAGLPGGFKLGLGRYEREKVNYLSGFVRGGLLDLRAMRRIPIRLPVNYRIGAESRQGFTRDLNEAGLFIVDEDPLPEESEIQLELAVPDRGEPIALIGTVSHTVVVADEDVPGMGVRLDLDGAAQAEFKAVVDELERRFNSGDLPDDALL